MGVPLRRPTAAPLKPELPSPDVLDPAWLDVLRFCGVPDLGACIAVSRCWCSATDSHHVWADAYERTQRADAASAPAGECSLRALIERPFGEDAVGWRVAVLVEDGTERQATGHIVAYDAEADAYLIAYEGTGDDASGALPQEVWEHERRRRTAAMRHNPSLAGKSRFSFLSPPTWPWMGGMQSSSASGTAGSASNPQCSRDRATRTSPQQIRSWKEELKNNVRNAPSRLLTRLEEHTDEVLFVVFSPDGLRLASCSRDLRTVIFRVRSGGSGEASFDREAVFAHQTAPCRAIWWPQAPFDTVAVSTEDAGWQGASKVEIWEILNGQDTYAWQAPFEAEDEDQQLPMGINARCIFQGQNRPFDIYAALLQWPPALEDDPTAFCFLAGWAVFRENQRYIQWLNVWPGPRHPRFLPGKEPQGGGGSQPRAPAPLARLRLEGEMNYLHCLEVGPKASQGKRILAMTGSTPHLCNELGFIDLSQLRQRDDPAHAGQDAVAIPNYDAPVEVKSMGDRVVLSAKWSSSGDLVLLNTRPYAQRDRQPRSGHSRSRRGSGRPPLSQPTPSFEDLLMQPAPDLSTSMELILLDVQSLETVAVFDGHFAFTTKESPFLIFTDEWADTDFLASGGEDHRVYVWHRRHRRLVRRLCGHTEPVNAVSWNGNGLLASASDDHRVIVWAAGAATAADGWVAHSLTGAGSA